eukprot:COSAG02_NODE_23676_length_711_cov_1.116013_1_plen_127_part_10
MQMHAWDRAVGRAPVGGRHKQSGTGTKRRSTPYVALPVRVDYLVSELIHQNRGRLERMIQGTCDKEAAEPLIKEMRKVFTFAKSSFVRRIGTSTCASHDAKFALGIETESDDHSPHPISDLETAAIF